MEVELTITDHYSMETRVVVRELPAILGRDEQADIYLRDPWASRKHCILAEIGEALVVSDLGSKNGIFLNGHRVRESQLMPGDRFAIGRTEITVHYQQPAGAESRSESDAATAAGAKRRPANPETLDLLYGIVIEPTKPRSLADDTRTGLE
jgi:pSer/pThr/pTyr-binding forkhead associated (FHA) protein